MKIIYTKHARKKFKMHRDVGIIITGKDVSTTIKDPEHVDYESDKPKTITSKSLKEKLVLRVVFKTDNDIIKVITFYPAQAGRYYENKKTKN